MNPRYVRAKVSGDVPVRDVLTRESVEPGGVVTLLVRTPGETYRCPRHPKRGAGDPKAACLCTGTLIDTLVEQGVISDVRPVEKTEKPKA